MTKKDKTKIDLDNPWLRVCEDCGTVFSIEYLKDKEDFAYETTTCPKCGNGHERTWRWLDTDVLKPPHNPVFLKGYHPIGFEDNIHKHIPCGGHCNLVYCQEQQEWVEEGNCKKDQKGFYRYKEK